MEQHRLIFSLYLDLEPEPGSPRGASAALVVPLRPDGMAAGGYGRPRPPKQRTIDLRVGDDVMVDGQWRAILSISAYHDGWITLEQLDTISGGYVVRPK